jgi:AbrB family looped-hinge helix DNA binding protein
LVKKLGEAKLTSKGQLTVPLEVRRFLKLGRGDYVIFKEDNGAVALAKAVLKEV